MPIFDFDPGQSPEAPGTLYFYKQGTDPSTGFQVTSEGLITSAGGVNGPVNFTGAAAATDALTARVTNDVQPRFVIDSDGTLRWGPGNGATDYSIARYAVGGLEVSGALRFTSGQLLFGPSGDVNLYRGPGTEELKTDDNLVVGGAFAVGASCMGRATLAAGTVTVNNTRVTANSNIFLTIQTPAGTVGSQRISSRVAGTSFTITSTQAADTSVVAWFLVEPS